MALSGVLWINAKTNREANFYIKQLSGERFFNRRCNIDMTLEEKNRYLNSLIKDKRVINNERELKKLFEHYNQSKFERYNWFWLTPEQKRAINWKWGYIKTNRRNILEKSGDRTARHNRNDKGDLDISKIINSKIDRDYIHPTTEDKLNYIIDFLYDLNSTKRAKIIERQLFEVWKKVKCEPELESYLQVDDINKCKWAYGYLKSIDILQEQVDLFVPLNESDYYGYSIAIFDLISDKIYKEHFLKSMRKAWTQKKYRSKQNGKKAYSISMSPNTKNKLEHIVERTDSKICDTIERLINDEYERLN